MVFTPYYKGKRKKEEERGWKRKRAAGDDGGGGLVLRGPFPDFINAPPKLRLAVS